MKNMNIIKSLVLVSLFTCFSCETLELDKSNDPFSLSPDQADVNFLFNGIEENFVRQIEGDSDYDASDNWQSGGSTNGDGLSLFGGELTRMYGMNSPNANNYLSVFQGSDSDDEWLNAYAGILKNIRTMEVIAESKGLKHHIGIAQFIEWYKNYYKV